MIIVKVGGSILDQHMEKIAQDLAGREFVLVHGIGPQMDEMTRALGREPQWYTSVSGIKCRHTGEEEIKIYNMVVAGMNNEIVVTLRTQGVDSVGMLACLRAKRKDRIKVVENGRKRIIAGDYSGKITGCSVALLRDLLENGKNPVVPPIAVSENFELVNVNGDRAAAVLARDLSVDTIINLSDVAGVLREGEVIPEVGAFELEDLRREVTGGMTMKLLGIKEALDFGVKKVVIAPGNVEKPISNALEGYGTVFRNG